MSPNRTLLHWICLVFANRSEFMKDETRTCQWDTQEIKQNWSFPGVYHRKCCYYFLGFDEESSIDFDQNISTLKCGFAKYFGHCFKGWWWSYPICVVGDTLGNMYPLSCLSPIPIIGRWWHGPLSSLWVTWKLFVLAVNTHFRLSSKIVREKWPNKWTTENTDCECNNNNNNNNVPLKFCLFVSCHGNQGISCSVDEILWHWKFAVIFCIIA